MATLTCRPARGHMNQGFGPRPKPTPTSPAKHYGQDYGWGGGDNIYAAAAGKVISYGPSGAYGNRLVVEHAIGFRTWYCHLSASLVKVGDRVLPGEVVAQMGATGNVTAKHLHFEVRLLGVAVDPEGYFKIATPVLASFEPVAMSVGTEEDDMGYYITTGKQAARFWFSLATGRKRSIGQSEWAFLRAHEKASGQPLVIVTVTQAELDGRPGK